MAPFKQCIVNIAEICAQKNVVNFIISPGSRSAPLTLAFLRHPQITCRTIVDERCAAFMALGLAQQIDHAVGLVCTSGTAALNYAPAIAEAHYQQIPLLIFTADRPPEWIDQNDGQTIHQREMYGKFCRASFDLPVDSSHPDAKWQIERTISEAINTAVWPTPGPVHVNVPLREPLYPAADLAYQNDARIISTAPQQNILPGSTWKELISTWHRAEKKLIVAGLNKPNPSLANNLIRLSNDDTVTFLSDITSNLHDCLEFQHCDAILGTENEQVLQELTPDLLISFGGPVVSKNLKLFLRKHKPKVHWQIQSHREYIDTFQSLTQIVPVAAEYFFEQLAKMLSPAAVGDLVPPAGAYSAIWRKLESSFEKALEAILEIMPHCELTAMSSILRALPESSHLQLGNSFIVRLASFIGLGGTRQIKVNSNRGTSGIDGTLSTAVGAALATAQITTLVTGDLAFFYDRNALWHNYLPSNLRIIIINNYGGGIFRILDGPRDLPELAQHFEVTHQLTAENTAADHGLTYFTCDSKAGLESTLPEFFQPKEKAAILEVHTDKEVNAATFLQFKSIMKELK